MIDGLQFVKIRDKIKVVGLNWGTVDYVKELLRIYKLTGRKTKTKSIREKYEAKFIKIASMPIENKPFHPSPGKVYDTLSKIQFNTALRVFGQLFNYVDDYYDQEMIEMFLDDTRRHLMIALHLSEGREVLAKRWSGKMDTVSSEMLSIKVWNYLWKRVEKV